MLNFSVGPVMSANGIRRIASNQIPYFRTLEFSNVIFENEKLLKKCFKAPDSSRVIFITGSGTASMEAAVINTLSVKDKILIINGGTFGQRFCDICEIHGFNYEILRCDYGKTLTGAQLSAYENKGFTALLVNLCETSTGVLYDIDLISAFCKRNGIFLIVDLISSFLCDPFDMEKLGANVVLTGSQKALALAPGCSFICLDAVAVDRVLKLNSKTLYFNLKDYIKDGDRGQTPFTPAVGILLQLNYRLKLIDKNGGVDTEVKKAKKLAEYFSTQISDLPFNFFSDKPSNAVTALTLKAKNKSAYSLFEVLKDEYQIFVCPNGGELKNEVFRVGHMGDLKYADYDKLIYAFKELQKRNLL